MIGGSVVQKAWGFFVQGLPQSFEEIDTHSRDWICVVFFQVY